MPVVILLANGFEETEAVTVVDVLRRADIDCRMISIHNGLEVVGAHDIKILCDTTIDQIEPSDCDMVILPGGGPGTNNLKASEKVIQFVQQMNRLNKFTAAICAAPTVLEKAGIINGKKVTSYPGFEKQLVNVTYLTNTVVEDDNIITSRGPATSMEFGLTLVEKLKGKAIRDDLSKKLLCST